MAVTGAVLGDISGSQYEFTNGYDAGSQKGGLRGKGSVKSHA